MLEILVEAIWFILPAYLANGTPVILGGGPPIDGGKKFSDGNRILGNGKTFRGLISGISIGVLIGLIQTFSLGRPGGFTAAILLSIGALTADIIGSFLKRRAGIQRGSPVPGLDQLDFAIGGLLLVSPVVLPKWETTLTILLVTPLIHVGMNYISYKLNLKSEPY